MTGLEVFLMIGTISSWVSTGVVIAAQVAINRLQSKVNNCQQKINNYYEQRINEIDHKNDYFNVDDIAMARSLEENNSAKQNNCSIQPWGVRRNEHENSNEV
jgi:cupin superfamily acireductone dioxygenase involved in methionine salvage